MPTYSFTTYTGDGSTTNFTVPFSYINQSDVKVYLDGVLKVVTTDYTWFNSTTIKFNTAPANGVVIRLERDTNIAARSVDFEDGGNLTEATLDTAHNQFFFLIQEIYDGLENEAIVLNTVDVYDANGKRISNVADPVDAQDVVTKAYGDANYGGAAAATATAAAAAAETAWDAFDDRYLGAKASDPALDNDGNALLAGALYWNTSTSKMKVYNGSAWDNVQSNELFLSVKDYGATGDYDIDTGVGTDDTVAIQACINDALVSGGSGAGTKAVFFPPGAYKITAALTLPNTTSDWRGWRMFSQSVASASIVQATDNTPIIKLTGHYIPEFIIERLTLMWKNQQTAAHTQSVAIAGAAESSYSIYLFTLRDLRIAYGYRGVAHTTTNISIWGCHMERIWFVDMAGSAINLQPNPSVGQPQVYMNNIYIGASKATETLINLAATAFTIGTLEVNTNTNGVLVMYAGWGAGGTVAQISEEGGYYDGTNGNKIIFVEDGHLDIEHLVSSGSETDLGGTNPMFLITTGGTKAKVHVETLALNHTVTSGQLFVFAGGNGSSAYTMSVGKVWDLTNAILTEVGSYLAANSVTVDEWNRGKLSDDNGDNSITVGVDDENIQSFETILTANRSVTLPRQYSPSPMFNGKWFRVVRNESTPSAYVIDVYNGEGTWLGQIPASTNGMIEFTYRRIGYVKTGYATW